MNTARSRPALLSSAIPARMVMEETLANVSRGLFIRTYDNQQVSIVYAGTVFELFTFGDYLRMNISGGLNHFQSNKIAIRIHTRIPSM